MKFKFLCVLLATSKKINMKFTRALMQVIRFVIQTQRNQKNPQLINGASVKLKLVAFIKIWLLKWIFFSLVTDAM